MRPRHLIRGRATLGEAFAAANPELAGKLAHFSNPAGARRRPEQPRAEPQREGQPRPAGGARRHDPSRRRDPGGSREAGGAIAPLNASPDDSAAIGQSWRGYAERVRGREINRRRQQSQGRARELARPGRGEQSARGLAQAELAALGTLVVLPAIDRPCNFTIAAARDNGQGGFAIGYLDSDLYNTIGWLNVEAGEIVAIADFGALVDILPSDGAWRYRTLFPAGQRAWRGLAWSGLDVGHSVLHIRWRTDILAARRTLADAKLQTQFDAEQST